MPERDLASGPPEQPAGAAVHPGGGGEAGAGPGLPSAPVLGIRLSTLDTAATIEALIGAAGAPREGRGRCFLAGYANPHVADLVATHPALASDLGRFDLVYPDGVGMVWAARILGHRVPERVTASDFLPALCRRAAAEGLSVYFFGHRAELAEETARRMAAAAPGLEVAGTHHGYLLGDPGAERSVLAELERTRPAICVVGMGSPQQEAWMAAHARRLAPSVGVLWAVGGAFEFHAGVVRRAPRWIQVLGAEWLFRWALAPRRLTSRYTAGNLRFLAAIARARLGR